MCFHYIVVKISVGSMSLPPVSLDHLNYYVCVMDYVDLLINHGV